jgi:(2R)-3-sulfolactate dehydrogenase (NADP+)
MLLDPDLRLPGSRRDTLEQQARDGGVELPPALLDQLQALAVVNRGA